MIEEAAKRTIETERRVHVTVAHVVDRRIGKRKGGDAPDLRGTGLESDVAVGLVKTKNPEKTRINHPSNQRQLTQRKKSRMNLKSRCEFGGRNWLSGGLKRPWPTEVQVL
jgi:hypothetical protein